MSSPSVISEAPSVVLEVERQGPPGPSGQTPALRNNGVFIQYKYPSDEAWTNLVAVEDLQADNAITSATTSNGTASVSLAAVTATTASFTNLSIPDAAISIQKVDGLQSALSGKQATLTDYSTVSSLTGYPASFPTAPAEINNVGTGKLIGRHGAGTGTAQEIGIDGGLELHGGNLRRAAVTGPVTIAAGGATSAIANDALSIAMTSGLQTALDNRKKFENWVFEGDSWTSGIAQSNDRETYPYYLARLAPQYGVNFYNVATSGQTAATMVSTFAAQVAPYLTTTTGLPSTAFIFAGINDAQTRTTTQLRDDLRSLWTSARNAGARVVAFTLPHREAIGGWSQADWKIINTQIIADASYYDFLVRTDIIFPNAQSNDYFEQTPYDLLHVGTNAHKKLAAQVWNILNGGSAYPSLWPDLTCSHCVTSSLTANVTRALAFTEVYDTGTDATTATVGADTGVRVFTVPVDGKYEVSTSVIFGGLTSGDVALLSIYITPAATGTAVEHRLGESFDHAAGANMGAGGTKRFNLLRGDKIHIGALSARTGATILANGNFSTFQVRLASIP